MDHKDLYEWPDYVSISARRQEGSEIRLLKAERDAFAKEVTGLKAANRGLKAQNERLQNQMAELTRARAGSFTRAGAKYAFMQYDQVCEALKEMQDNRDWYRAQLEYTKSPTEACKEERERGAGGCGVCGLCCKELREQLEESKYHVKILQGALNSQITFLDETIEVTDSPGSLETLRTMRDNAQKALQPTTEGK